MPSPIQTTLLVFTLEVDSISGRSLQYLFTIQSIHAEWTQFAKFSLLMSISVVHKRIHQNCKVTKKAQAMILVKFLSFWKFWETLFILIIPNRCLFSVNLYLILPISPHCQHTLLAQTCSLANYLPTVPFLPPSFQSYLPVCQLHDPSSHFFSHFS